MRGRTVPRKHVEVQGNSRACSRSGMAIARMGMHELARTHRDPKSLILRLHDVLTKLSNAKARDALGPCNYCDTLDEALAQESSQRAAAASTTSTHANHHA